MDNEINVRSTRSRARKREKISNVRKETCVFEEKEKKAAIPIDYLDQLHARIESLEAQSRSVRGLDSNTEALSSGSVQLSARYSSRNPPQSPLGETRTPSRSESSSLTNTLVTSEPQVKVHRYGHAAYLGHSSTLSFSRNVRNLLQQSSPIADPGSVSMERQDISYTQTLPPIALDLSSIAFPKLSYAEYLTNTMLLILAFGKSIQSRHSEMGPSGMNYFTLAIEAMPDIRRLYEDPLLSIEVLCLAALFMHATDILQEAYVTIGQALRISVTKVLNKRFPEALRSSNFEYQRRLWLTVYCIDRKCAAMLGSPSVMRDEDISIPFPEINPGDESQNALVVRAILFSHLGKILDAIYGVHDQQRNFLLEVKSIKLSRIAETYVILRQHLPLDVQQPSQPVSRESATLHLLLHKCVILTVRPVLFSLLRPLLASNAPIPYARHSSSPFESVLKMCIESAVQILKIMSILKQQMICGEFDSTFCNLIDDLNVEGFDISDTDMLDNAWVWDMDDMSATSELNAQYYDSAERDSEAYSRAIFKKVTSWKGKLKIQLLFQHYDADFPLYCSGPVHPTASSAYAPNQDTPKNYQLRTYRAFSASIRSYAAMEQVFSSKAVAQVPAIGPYTQAIKANGMVFLSGQIPVDSQARLIEGTIAEKKHKMCQNAKANMDDMKDMNEVYAEYVPHKPARSACESPRLPAGASKEMDIIALQ
ncbi:BRT1 down-regulated by mating factor B [Fusarium mundagurra]|uniref:BRT1 down-regulated by mating factor B n=1 Tax=Fusarium mundagurra TaxID=1567541 RepID=A0A8H5YQ13_9HYPO|nr:BRT1 down-regulated by mating factor B [Fusarium mundagurra]